MSDRKIPDESPDPARTRRPVVVGEVLFDVFPDGHEVLGGAPFNVAWNLRGLGLDPLLITRIGEDSRGRRILDAMETWGLDRAGVQIDRSLPTGIVRVTVEDGQPAYDIVPDQAYDAIDGEVAGRVAREADPAILVRGTLAARSAASRTAIAWLQTMTAAPVFLDVNLRAPWWDPQRVREALSDSRWVKVNDDELFRVVDDGHGFRGDPAEHVAAARTLLEDHGLEAIVLTRGADGATWIDRRRDVAVSAPTPPRFVDAVGAGDAFASMVVAGRLVGREPSEALASAAGFAAAVCGLRGATTTDPDLYRAAARDAGLPGPQAGGDHG